MMRIAIIGCGKIADQHLQAIARIPDCQVVGLCDCEILMARQLGERFGISACFSDPEIMLNQTRPEVVHVTAPPQSHFPLGLRCLASGRHVYLEKPFTVNAREAEELVEKAKSTGLKLTVGHNYQFTLEMLEMRRLINQGFLGGKPVHLESHFTYSLSDLTYVGPLLGNRSHWVRQLPGQLIQNLISHGVARLAEFLDPETTELSAQAHQSDELRRLGGEEILDELRVSLRDGSGTTAFFCFSTQIKPGLSQLRMCGPKNSILVDQTSGTLSRAQQTRDKSYLTYFLPPLRSAREQMSNFRQNVTAFARRNLYQDAGMTELIHQFYKSIQSNAPLPIPYDEILFTARIMDTIFAQIYPGNQKPAAALEAVK
jgi:predicted dehydrogenase